MWAWQVQYDVRYEANDIVHRVFKCLHIMLFIYIGAASAGWDLNVYTMFDPVEDTDPFEHVIFQQADTAFLTVALALIIQRVLLVIQYLMGEYTPMITKLIDSRRSGIVRRPACCRPVFERRLVTLRRPYYGLRRRYSCQQHAHDCRQDRNALPLVRVRDSHFSGSRVEACANACSGPRSGRALWSIHLDYHVGTREIPAADNSGEGFLNLSRAFQKALSGESAGDATLYAQVFMGKLILVLLQGY